MVSKKQNKKKKQFISSRIASVDRDETIYHIISVRSKQAQREYRSRREWVGKVSFGELCKK